ERSIETSVAVWRRVAELARPYQIDLQLHGCAIHNNAACRSRLALTVTGSDNFIDRTAFTRCDCEISVIW
ncbi:hypothetical protein J6590_012859, partial [Homalodisca vitripennis]